MNKVNICPACGKPVDGVYLDAKVYHFRCAFDDAQIARDNLSKLRKNSNRTDSENANS